MLCGQRRRGDEEKSAKAKTKAERDDAERNARVVTFVAALESMWLGLKDIDVVVINCVARRKRQGWLRGREGVGCGRDARGTATPAGREWRSWERLEGRGDQSTERKEYIPGGGTDQLRGKSSGVFNNCIVGVRLRRRRGGVIGQQICSSQASSAKALSMDTSVERTPLLRVVRRQSPNDWSRCTEMLPGTVHSGTKVLGQRKSPPTRSQ
eukprot:3981324-Pyramimonas_sp.AAC.1